MMQQNATQPTDKETAAIAIASQELERMKIAVQKPNVEVPLLSATTITTGPPGIPPLVGGTATRSALLRPYLAASTSERGTADD